MSILLDVIVLALIILMAFLGYRKGFVSALIDIVGYVASIIVATALSLLIASAIFSSMVRPALVNTVKQTLTDSSASVAQQAETVYEKLPGFITGLAGQYGVTPDRIGQEISNAVENSTESAAEAVIDTAIAPVVTSMLRLLAFFILFFICLAIVRLLSRMTAGRIHIPIIGTLNQVLGGALGFLKGMLLICVIATVLVIIVPFLPQDGVINQRVIDQSVAFKVFYDYNPLTAFLLNGKG